MQPVIAHCKEGAERWGRRHDKAPVEEKMSDFRSFL
jgi:hypothetical protein